MSREKAKAIIYCRVSNQKQVKEGDGLNSQDTRCREFAKSRGYEVIASYHEQGVSGKMLDRPKIKELLAFLTVNKGNYVVLIDDISRLARSIKAHIELRAAILKTGAKLDSPSVHFGNDADSLLVENMLALMAGHQGDKNAETTINRMKARVSNGYWVNNRPLGYRYQQTKTRGKILIRNEPIASIVAEGLVGFSTGRFRSNIEIKRFFEQHEDFPKNKHGKVYLQLIAKLLVNPIYAGIVNMPNWGIYNVKGQHEPLISLETFERNQQRLDQNRSIKPQAVVKQNFREDFILRGHVRCAHCSNLLTGGLSRGKSGKQYAYYHCQKKGCEMYGKSIRRDKLESEFGEMVKNLTPSAEFAVMTKALLKAIWDENISKAKDRKDKILKAIEELDKSLSQTIDRLMTTTNKTIINAYEGKVVEIEEKKLVLQEKLAKCSEPPKSFESRYRTSIEFLTKPYKLWCSENPMERTCAAKLLFNGGLSYCRNEGYRTPSKSQPYRLLCLVRDGKYDMVQMGRLELPRPRGH